MKPAHTIPGSTKFLSVVAQLKRVHVETPYQGQALPGRGQVFFFLPDGRILAVACAGCPSGNQALAGLPATRAAARVAFVQRISAPLPDFSQP
jgi:hypothetical protein